MTTPEALIDRIYQAAVDPDIWSSVLDDISRAVDGAAATLLTSRNDHWVGWRHSTGAPDSWDEFLRSPAAARSQTTPRLLQANRAGFVADHEVFTREEWLTDPMMSECLSAQNLLHAAATAIHMPNGDFVVVQIQRRTGLPVFSPTDIAQLDQLRPHLARAALLAVRWRLEKLRAATEALALVGLLAAAVDSSGRVLAANELIQTSSQWITWLPRDRIALVDPAANTLFQRAIAELHSPASTCSRSIALRSNGPAGAGAAVVHLIPTTGTARDLFGGSIGLVVLTPVSAGGSPADAILRALFDLTPAEARVASGIAEGLSLGQIAARHAVSVETVRVQAKAIFAKTGATRQAQVAALLAGLPRDLAQ